MRAILAGGGTTGHISPMLATAEALKSMVPSVSLVCVGTEAGLETAVVPQSGLRLELIDPVPMPRSISTQLASLPLRVAKAVGQAKKILEKYNADVVVGFGGYASLPVFLAARALKVPLVVHEANAVPGLANKVGARFADRVCVTFSNTGLPRQIVTGMPVRSVIATLDRKSTRTAARTYFELPSEGSVLLVSGGSQGAKTLNDAVLGALAALDSEGVSVLHVTGKKNFDEPHVVPELVQSVYRRVAYVDRMEEAYSAADLMLARSGSGTVTETAIIGLPGIFVPFPHGNGEQAKNVASLIEADAGVLVSDAELTAARLAREVSRLLCEDGELERMGKAAQNVMPRDAAERVARLAVEVSRRSEA